MKSAFLGGAYKVRSLPLGAQTAVNLYLEPNEAGSGDAGAFYGTPGKARLALLDGGAHRESLPAGGYLWCVVGANVYRLDSSYAATLIGTLPNSTGPVAMAENGRQLLIAHPGGWHVVTLASGAIAPVADAPTTSDISFLDNYGLTVLDNGTYGWTNLADFSVINPLNFASAEGDPDKAIRTLTDHREGWLFGERTTEIVVINGDPDLPFTRTTFIEQGILAPRSACKADNSVLWLGRNEKGQGVVWRADGYTPTRISTFAIEQAIARTDAASARAFTYQQDGHHFYVLCLPGETWAYDLNTGLWHQRAWLDPTTGELRADRAATHAMFNGVHVVGDRADGRLYRLDLDTYTDDGDPIYRERAWREADVEARNTIVTRADLIADVGVGLDGIAPWGLFITAVDAVGSGYVRVATPLAMASGADYRGRFLLSNGSAPVCVLSIPRRNLLTRTQEFDLTAPWTRVQIADVTPNATVAPDGSTTAEKLISNTTATNHYLDLSFNGLADNAIVSASIFVKKADYDCVRLNVITKNGSGPTLGFRFSTKSIVTAAQGTGNSGIAFSFEELADGWFRLKMEGINILAGATVPRFRPFVVGDDPNNPTAAGDGVKGTYFWGAQLEVGSTATEYQRVDAAVVGSPWGGERYFATSSEIATAGIGTPVEIGVGDYYPEPAGLDPQVSLSWSYDGALTWSSSLARSLGKVGEYRKRVFWTRLGKSRRRDWKLTTSAPVRICWRAFLFNGEVCAA